MEFKGLRVFGGAVVFLSGIFLREGYRDLEFSIRPTYIADMTSKDKKPLELIVAQYVDAPETRQELFMFYREVYPQAPWLLDNKDFIWRNLTSPVNGPLDSGVWLLRSAAGRILGQNIYIRTPLSVSGVERVGICSTNLIVRPEMVGSGSGHLLIQQNEGFDGTPYAVGITPASTRAFLKRGWLLYTKAKLHSRFIRPKPNLTYVKITGAKRFLLSLAIRLANSFSALWSAIFAEPTVRGLQVREVGEFDPADDSIWQSFLRDFAIHYSRTAEFLNYKYSSRDSTTHHRLLFEIDDKPVGYGIYRVSEHPTSGLRLGRIVDFVYDPSMGKRLISSMIGVIVARLTAQDIDGLVAVSSTPEIARALRDNGLFMTRVQPAIIKEAGFELEKLMEKYKYAWHITLGDSDLDNYW